jgi:hypothetical protein
MEGQYSKGRRIKKVNIVYMATIMDKKNRGKGCSKRKLTRETKERRTRVIITRVIVTRR